MGGDFYSPRHRHNFEQVRFQIEGTLDYGRNGKLTKGMVGYFPEGMHYGPQSQDPEDTPMTAVLQCGGASGSGYLSRNESKAGMEELSRFGEFKDGVFRRNEDAEGKRNMDGYQAIWEHKHGRAMVCPEPRYNSPIFMDPAHYEWLPVEGAPGVTEKLLGIFSECHTEAGFLKLDAGAAYRAGGRGLYFVVSGTGTIDGQPLRRFTTLFVGRGETASIEATGTAEILHLGLPDLASIGIGDGKGEGKVAAAAAAE